jgi:prepilin-type N-terminal cleavage/methylation domain-containing protein
VRRAGSGGFTLIEVVVALVLLSTTMLLLYSGLSFALRSWDAGDVNGRRTADRRLGENFLRRELSELFPMRWKDATQLKLAFEGGASRLRFVSSRAPGLQMGGLALVGLEVEEDGEKKTKDLVMYRAMPDDEAVGFGPLDRGERHVVLPGIDEVAFGYFGSENEFAEPKWHDTWEYAGRVPEMLRIRLRGKEGNVLPEMLVRLALGEEAGCLENSFQRLCRPRRPT